MMVFTNKGAWNYGRKKESRKESRKENKSTSQRQEASSKEKIRKIHSLFLFYLIY